jgi:hypothetical protein
MNTQAYHGPGQLNLHNNIGERMKTKYDLRDLFIKCLVYILALCFVPIFAYIAAGLIFDKRIGLFVAVIFFILPLAILLFRFINSVYFKFDEQGFSVYKTFKPKKPIVHISWSSINDIEYDYIANSADAKAAKLLYMIVYTNNYAHKPDIQNEAPKSGYGITISARSFTAKTMRQYIKEYRPDIILQSTV